MSKRPEEVSSRLGGAVAALTELDQDIMKLLVRRAKLVFRIRGGHKHAATPQAVKAEKEVRLAWEQNAMRFSRDTRFARQLFSLLQELEVSSREEAEARTGFHLAPARKPVSIDLPGPAALRAVRFWAAMAAGSGAPLCLTRVLLGDALIDCVKALNQTGAHLSWTTDGILQSAGGSSLGFGGKVLYAGEDSLTFYLLAFMAAGQSGKTRFTGGAGLKMADLSPLRRFLPQLGARLAYSVPKSTGLPAAVEASGMLPDQVTLPDDLPLDALSSLFCVASTWLRPIRFDLSALPAGRSSQALAEVLPLLHVCGIEAAVHGAVLYLNPVRKKIPEQPVLPMDPACNAYLLALSAFAGGSVLLHGVWDTLYPGASEAVSLLQNAGLSVEFSAAVVRTALPDGSVQTVNVSQPMDFRSLPETLFPLGVAFAALVAFRSREPVPAPLFDPDYNAALAQDFLERLGLTMEEGLLCKQNRSDAISVPWSCPDPYWGMAFALCAYICPGLHLINPGMVTELTPPFWALYNSLPVPSLRPKTKDVVPLPTRRRIIT